MFRLKTRIKINGVQGLLHITNNEDLSRMDYGDFNNLKNHLKGIFQNKLNFDLYKNGMGKAQPVYEYHATRHEIMDAIHDYDEDIELI